MKKKFLVITVAQAIVILLLLIFSVLQKTEADKQRELAEMNANNARQQIVISEQMKIQMRSEIESLRAELARLQNR